MAGSRGRLPARSREKLLLGEPAPVAGADWRRFRSSRARLLTDVDRLLHPRGSRDAEEDRKAATSSHLGTLITTDFMPHFIVRLNSTSRPDADL